MKECLPSLHNISRVAIFNRPQKVEISRFSDPHSIWHLCRSENVQPRLAGRWPRPSGPRPCPDLQGPQPPLPVGADAAAGVQVDRGGCRGGLRPELHEVASCSPEQDEGPCVVVKSIPEFLHQPGRGELLLVVNGLKAFPPEILFEFS